MEKNIFIDNQLDCLATSFEDLDGIEFKMNYEVWEVKGAFIGFEGGLVTQVPGLGQEMVTWCSQKLNLFHTGCGGSFGVSLDKI